MLTRLGHYRLIKQIGEGGMGSVYEAVRDDGQFEQKVAIKLLRPGSGNIDRFEAERRLLAQLRHPYIANLIDGGTFEGIPYIVMELIDGVPISKYVADNHLDLRGRLELFILVCEAVQHAHSSLIVHRDLKPANILVTPDGVPKLLDFGIAKYHGSQSTLLAPLTPRYASPEQYTSDLITTASDVYSLGIVLKELTSGVSPDDDLTNVLAMATRPEPHRRYGSVAQFGEDIRRYLDGHMVIAKPDTPGYRFSKFARRNPLPVTLSFLLLFTLLIGSGFVYREGMRAQRRFDEVHSLLSSVLNEMDAAASPLVGSAKVRQMMVEKSLNYLNRLAAESGGDRALRMELAKAYHKVGDIQGHRRFQNLGLYNESLESHRKGIQIEEALFTDDPQNQALRNQLAWGYSHIAELHSYRGDSESALAYAGRALPLIHSSDPSIHVDSSISLSRVLHFDGQVDRALKLLQSALQVSSKLGPLRQAALLKWASEEAEYMGLVPLALQYTEQSIQLLNGIELTGNDVSRMYIARRERGVQLSQASNPSEERHCEAIPDLEFAVAGQTDIWRQDSASINRMIQVVTAMQMLSASQALCGKTQAIQSAKDAFTFYNRDKKRENSNLEWHLAFAHLKLGQVREAADVLETVKNPDETILELKAEILMARKQFQNAVNHLKKARAIRAPQLKLRHFEHRFWCYHQARNIQLALSAGDTTSGLREEGLRLLDEFPQQGVARSIVRLRRELSQ